MAFPKMPYKPVVGSLKLSIRSPDVEVVVGEQEQPPTLPDVSGQLNFNLPKGFSMSTDPKEQVDLQRTRVQSQIDAVREKRGRCGACRNATSEKMLDVAEEFLYNVTGALAGKGLTVKIRFNQEKDGSLVTYYEAPERTLGIKVTASTVEVGHFMPTGVNSEKKYRITAYKSAEHTAWLVGIE